MYESIVESLLASTEPAIRWKARSRVLGEPTASPQMTALREEIRGSATVRRLLAPLGAADPPAVYAKWQGAHWVLGALAELGYPPGDEALHPLREQVLNTWLHEAYHRDVELATKSAAYRHSGVPVMRGRCRAHASQQGNALRSLLTLGLADARCDRLVELLLHWQWPDGGWNCDRDPAADTSSFCETLLPMRGLWAHGTAQAKRAARAAAEVFLERRLAYRASTGLDAGFHAVVELPQGTDEATIIAAATQRSIHLHGMHRYRVHGATDRPVIVFGFGDLNEHAIRSGNAQISDLLLPRPTSDPA